MELFQRHVTTAAFKIAGGVDLSSTALSKPVKQNPIATAFVSKITKAFLDVLYAFLDGLVLLASDESPIVTGKRPIADPATVGTNPLELHDLVDGVRDRPRFASTLIKNFHFLRRTPVSYLSYQTSDIFRTLLFQI